MIRLRIAVVVLLMLCAGGWSQSNKPAPGTINPEERDQFKDLRIKAYAAVAALQDAQKRVAQAQLDAERATAALKDANDHITAMVSEFRTKYSAPEHAWCLTSALTWVAAEGKPCPAW